MIIALILSSFPLICKSVPTTTAQYSTSHYCEVPIEWEVSKLEVIFRINPLAKESKRRSKKCQMY